MCGDVFKEWLKSLNMEMRCKNKKILLLIDNTGPHGRGPSTLTNVMVKYLPPSTTSHLQPLDAGIIASFKAHYRKLLLYHFIDQYDGKVPESTVSLKDAIYFLIDAWSELTATTIQNCWCHTGILDEGEAPAHPLVVEEELIQEVQVLIEHFNIDTLSATEFIDVDKAKSSFAYASEDEIVELINKKHDENSNEDKDLESEDEPLPLLSVQQGKEVLAGALRYCEERHSERLSPDFLRTLRALIQESAFQVQEEKRQLKLDSFLSNS